MEGILCNSGSAPKKTLVPRNTKKDRGNAKNNSSEQDEKNPREVKKGNYGKGNR